MLGIPIGLLAANAGEWLIHKHVLHGLGRVKDSFWSFHWHEHHRTCRKSAGADQAYLGSALRWNAQGKEALGLAAAGVAVLPLFPVAPFFTGAVVYSIVNYYVKHKRAHLDPAWAREHLPWHYDHHMGPNQHANWCVTRPWFDILVGTREPYVGTERERQDELKRERRARTQAARAAASAAAPASAPPAATSDAPAPAVAV